MTPDTIRILVVDDDEDDFEMTRAVVGAIENPEVSYEVEWASSWDEATAAFGRREHHVYFVDYLLDEGNGLDLVHRARRAGVREPLIMLTGRGSRDVDVRAMEAGASDYIVKDRIAPDVLERAIRYAMERFRSAEALRESEERYRGMFDHLPIGLYRCSPDGEFMDANPALVRLLGRPDAATVRESYARSFYVSPDDLGEFRSALESDGVVLAFETTLERPDGTPVRVRNTARAHRGPEGRIEYVEGAVEDVSEVEAARRLRGEAERFDVVWALSRLGILLLDEEGRIVRANPTFRRVFDYRAGDVADRLLADLASPEDRDALAAEVADVAAGRTETLESERRLVAGDDAVLWARLTAARVADADGRGARVMVLLDEVIEAGAGAGEEVTPVGGAPDA